MCRESRIRLQEWLFGSGVVITATLFRLALLLSHWPLSGGDEAIMGLMTLHIAFRGEHPIFFYGQHYMGALEAYASAPFFWLFGPGVFPLRLMLLLLYIGFFVSMYVLTRLLYTRRFALAITILLSLGSANITDIHLTASGGYPEILFFGAFLFALASWLALTTQEKRGATSTRQRWIRVLLYGVWGLFAGLALWADLLVLPVVVAAGFFLVCFCLRDMRLPGSLLLPGSMLLGAGPLLLYNFQAAPGANSLDVLRAQTIASPTLVPYFQRFAGAIFLSLPSTTGASPLCAINEPLAHINSISDPFAALNAHPMFCAVKQGLWSFGTLACWSVAILIVLFALVKAWNARSHSGWTAEERQSIIRQVGRLALLASAGMTFVPFILSTSPALFPYTMGRYLVCLQLAIPAVLWPIWSSATKLKSFKVSKRLLLPNNLLSLGNLLLLLLVGATYLRGSIGIIQHLPSTQATYQQRQVLLNTLLRNHITRFYSEYWTCNNLIFESQEQLICSNLLGRNLGPGQDRYQPYHDAVASTPHPGYVFPLGSDQAKGLDNRRGHLDIHYRRLIIPGYLIYYYDNTHPS